MQKLATRPNIDVALVRLAYQTAAAAHRGQSRAGGEPYITHCLAVADFIADLHLDTAAIAAGLLHDTLEDTELTEADLEKQFGKEITFLVKGVTKLGQIQYQTQPSVVSKQQLYAKSLRRLLLAMAKDIRVILIKLADRRHNLATLADKAPEARQRIALETLEIYAPIAERLGIGYLKGQLEDLAFPFVYPQAYHHLVKQVKQQVTAGQKYITKVRHAVLANLAQAGVIVTSADARIKHYYSLYKKMQRFDMDLNQINDLVALRVILPDVATCYEALGVIHQHYRPLPGRIKDYIALPRLNGYQSLHTTVFGGDGRMFEIQLRTPEMHRHAEHGVAAHWAYAESGKSKTSRADGREVEWVKQLKAWMEESDETELYKGLKIDFLNDRVFIFTPQGDIKDLPEGATPLDFAYAVHTEIGHHTGGAKVNGKLVALDYELESGQVVEIIKSKTAHPTLDWLRLIKTA